MPPGRITDLDTANRRYQALTASADKFEAWAASQVAQLRQEAAQKLAEADGLERALGNFRQFRQNPPTP